MASICMLYLMYTTYVSVPQANKTTRSKFSILILLKGISSKLKHRTFRSNCLLETQRDSGTRMGHRLQSLPCVTPIIAGWYACSVYISVYVPPKQTACANQQQVICARVAAFAYYIKTSGAIVATSYTSASDSTHDSDLSHTRGILKTNLSKWNC